MANQRLDARERSFFSRVSRAVFTNPFTEERVRLDLEIAGRSEPLPEAERIRSANAEINARIEHMERTHRADIRQYRGKDRVLLETSFLFEFFHRFLERFDHFIQQQVRSPDRSLKVPFVREALSYLQGRGFEAESVQRDFELVFQLRRAYFFIDRGLVGRSAAMQNLRRQLWNNVFTRDLDLYNRHLWDRMEDFSTLLLGETGTGKGTAAAAIGRSGFIPLDPRSGRFVESFPRSFVSLNLSQFPENLIESELFGHRKGSFTGAVDDYEGVFDRCSPHGAIFLDEIGEVSIPVQIKLLKVLQERSFRPVGSPHSHRFHGRVIAATNRPVDTLRSRGGMRDDFYYRLCSDIVTVPPLRERIRQDTSELSELTALLVERMLGTPSSAVVNEVLEVIDHRLGRDYPWPGNVRELEQCIRSVLLNGRYQPCPEPLDTVGDSFLQAVREGELNASQLLGGYCLRLHRRHGSYEAVGRITGLDRRTVKKYMEHA
jgi:hypothetical protein